MILGHRFAASLYSLWESSVLLPPQDRRLLPGLHLNEHPIPLPPSHDGVQRAVDVASSDQERVFVSPANIN